MQRDIIGDTVSSNNVLKMPVGRNLSNTSTRDLSPELGALALDDVSDRVAFGDGSVWEYLVSGPSTGGQNNAIVRFDGTGIKDFTSNPVLIEDDGITGTTPTDDAVPVVLNSTGYLAPFRMPEAANAQALFPGDTLTWNTNILFQNMKLSGIGSNMFAPHISITTINPGSPPPTGYTEIVLTGRGTYIFTLKCLVRQSLGAPTTNIYGLALNEVATPTPEFFIQSTAITDGPGSAAGLDIALLLTGIIIKNTTTPDTYHPQINAHFVGGAPTWEVNASAAFEIFYTPFLQGPL